MIRAMELSHLRCFILLAEDLDYGRASERLGISRSALSTHISRLEHYLGAALFVRRSRAVRLTSVARALLPLARTAVTALERIEARARDATSQARERQARQMSEPVAG